MKYLLVALIVTHSSGDHGPPIMRELETYTTLEDCEHQSEFIKDLFHDGQIWLGPNADPERIAYVRYMCKPVRG